MGCIGLECMAHSQDGQGCCTDPWAVACSDPSTSIECTLGHTLVGTTCLAGAYCSSTNTVLSDDGVGCCMDANAASCSNMITPTSCAENYELEGSGIYRCVFNEGSSLGSQNLLET
ncbi:BQ2448_2935 [Microbotryum intermedium]|uniref:BQ2448_2935 protein n=1 Tax=Microbotryum intermedium TaxID=269621 RepID=A0A238FDT4_9BASI|nr:BQ2448_2935 [Microbotryum intermedium]